MNTSSSHTSQPRNLLPILWLILAIGISACNGNTPTPPPGSFAYQLHVQEKDTGKDIEHALVRIEINGQAILTDVTDVYGSARIFVDASVEGEPARLTVEASGYKKYDKHIDLREEKLPGIIPLEALQPAPDHPLSNDAGSGPGPAPTNTTPPTCPWISYLNGSPTSALNDQNCLNDLKTVGISQDAEKISFFASGPSSGIYGACRDISNEKNLAFSVAVRDNIISARFLVTIGSAPVPNKSTHAFRIQPQIVSKTATDMYLKLIDYDAAGSGTDRNVMKAHPLWHTGHEWSFHFALEFTGSKASTIVNAMKDSPYEWSSNPASRYLCFAYEASPTSQNSAVVLETHITFP